MAKRVYYVIDYSGSHTVTRSHDNCTDGLRDFTKVCERLNATAYVTASISTSLQDGSASKIGVCGDEVVCRFAATYAGGDAPTDSVLERIGRLFGLTVWVERTQDSRDCDVERIRDTLYRGGGKVVCRFAADVNSPADVEGTLERIGKLFGLPVWVERTQDSRDCDIELVRDAVLHGLYREAGELADQYRVERDALRRKLQERDAECAQLQERLDKLHEFSNQVIGTRNEFERQLKHSTEHIERLTEQVARLKDRNVELVLMRKEATLTARSAPPPRDEQPAPKGVRDDETEADRMLDSAMRAMRKAADPTQPVMEANGWRLLASSRLRGLADRVASGELPTRRIRWYFDWRRMSSRND